MGTLPIHLFRHFCCRMYRLATTHSVTDRRIDKLEYFDETGRKRKGENRKSTSVYTRDLRGNGDDGNTAVTADLPR